MSTRFKDVNCSRPVALCSLLFILLQSVTKPQCLPPVSFSALAELFCFFVFIILLLAVTSLSLVSGLELNTKGCQTTVFDACLGLQQQRNNEDCHQLIFHLIVSFHFLCYFFRGFFGASLISVAFCLTRTRHLCSPLVVFCLTRTPHLAVFTSLIFVVFCLTRTWHLTVVTSLIYVVFCLTSTWLRSHHLSMWCFV